MKVILYILRRGPWDPNIATGNRGDASTTYDVQNEVKSMKRSQKEVDNISKIEKHKYAAACCSLSNWIIADVAPYDVELRLLYWTSARSAEDSQIAFTVLLDKQELKGRFLQLERCSNCKKS